MTVTDILNFILDREGGYANDPDDPGGETKYGIAKRYHPTLDIKALTEKQARDIYAANYWTPAGCSRFHTERPRLALCHMDWAVNGGVGRAVYYLQALLGVEVDGKFGPKTTQAAKTCNEDAVLDRYLALRAAHYRLRVGEAPEMHREMLRAAGIPQSALPASSRSQRKWLDNWTTRLRHVARATGRPIQPSFEDITP